MGQIHLEKVRKTFGDVVIIPELDLKIEDGEFVVFVGPSGCGKSTLLRLIAGLESISDGELRIADDVVNALMAIGLTDRGRHAAAERLRRETAELIEAHGFFEYFDPIDGTPCGGDAFTWTAAIWLTWAGAAGDAKGGA